MFLVLETSESLGEPSQVIVVDDERFGTSMRAIFIERKHSNIPVLCHDETTPSI